MLMHIFAYECYLLLLCVYVYDCIWIDTVLVIHLSLVFNQRSRLCIGLLCSTSGVPGDEFGE